jgi:hypothetical protein
MNFIQLNKKSEKLKRKDNLIIIFLELQKPYKK